MVWVVHFFFPRVGRVGWAVPDAGHRWLHLLTQGSQRLQEARSSHRGPCALCPGLVPLQPVTAAISLPGPDANSPILPQGTASFLVSHGGTRTPSPGLTHRLCPLGALPAAPAALAPTPAGEVSLQPWAGLLCWDESPLSYEPFLPEVCFAWLGWLGLDCRGSCGRLCRSQEVLQEGLETWPLRGLLDIGHGPCSVQDPGAVVEGNFKE